MAIIKCHECGKDVSTEAKTCPSCGAKVRKPKKAVGPLGIALAVIFVLYLIGSMMGASDRRASLEASKTPEQKALESKRSTQDAVAGIGAASLKKAMKDPASFKLTSLIVMADGTACYGYRAVNSFGASLPSSAVLLPSGKMLVEVHDGNAFIKAWNKGCANKSGRNIAQIVEMSGTLN